MNNEVLKQLYNLNYIDTDEKSLLTSINIPEIYIYNGNAYKITSIEDFAFNYYNKLTNIFIPSSVKSIGRESFCSCTALKDIKIAEGLETIGELAFGLSTALETIKIPNSVTSIKKDAFRSCSALKNVTLSKNLKNVETWAFSECTSLESIIIPDGVEIIGSSAFSRCTSLKNVNIPNSVTTIKNNAFAYCSSLENIYIPKSVTLIEYHAFTDCNSLKEVIIDNKKKNVKIGNNAFDKDVKIIFTEDKTIQEEKTSNYNKESSNYKEIGDITFIEYKEEDYIPKVEAIEEELPKEESEEETEKVTKDFIDSDSLDSADENLGKTEQERLKAEQEARLKAEKEAKERIAQKGKKILASNEKIENTNSLITTNFKNIIFSDNLIFAYFELWGEFYGKHCDIKNIKDFYQELVKIFIEKYPNSLIYNKNQLSLKKDDFTISLYKEKYFSNYALKFGYIRNIFDDWYLYVRYPIFELGEKIKKIISAMGLNDQEVIIGYYPNEQEVKKNAKRIAEEEPQKELKAEQEEVSTKEDTKQVEENINYIYPILKPLKEFSNKPIDLYSVQKAKIKAIKRGEKIENISLFDMFGKLQEKVKV